jgi:hypothetical protein
VDQLWRLDLTLTILVDGSYVTGKSEPNAIDLLLISLRCNGQSVKRYLDRVWTRAHRILEHIRAVSQFNRISLADPCCAAMPADLLSGTVSHVRRSRVP